MTRFVYETTVSSDWIDYNGHMRDAFYGLVFSYAVDAVQDEIGVDAAYREANHCTIYLVEDHKVYLREVKAGAPLRVETAIVDHNDKLFHLHMTMMSGDDAVCVGEFLELHVTQDGTPRAAPMPADVIARLNVAKLPASEAAELPHRSKRIAIERRKAAAA